MQVREGEIKEAIHIRIDKCWRGGAVILGRNCNLNCIWCHGDLFKEERGRIALENSKMVHYIERIIEAAGKVGVIRIAGNGEPTLLQKELVDLVRMLKRLEKVEKVKLTTNGTLLASLARKLAKAGLDSVNVSINSLNKEFYREITGRDLLAQVIEGVKRAKEEGIEVKINVIFTTYSLREIDDFIEFSREYQVPIKFFELIDITGRFKHLHLSIELLKEVLISICSEMKPYEYPYSGIIFKIRNKTSEALIDVKDTFSRNNCPNLKCPARNYCREGCRRYVRLGADGTLQPCGIRVDNVLQLADRSVTIEKIKEALKSGGKI